MRKLFSVGLALEPLGAEHRLLTPVCRQGQFDASGGLHGDLILVASVGPIQGADDAVSVFQDQGEVSAVLWENH